MDFSPIFSLKIVKYKKSLYKYLHRRHYVNQQRIQIIVLLTKTELALAAVILYNM